MENVKEHGLKNQILQNQHKPEAKEDTLVNKRGNPQDYLYKFYDCQGFMVLDDRQFKVLRVVKAR